VVKDLQIMGEDKATGPGPSIVTPSIVRLADTRSAVIYKKSTCFEMVVVPLRPEILLGIDLGDAIVLFPYTKLCRARLLF
jgi:hypothetical protein